MFESSSFLRIGWFGCVRNKYMGGVHIVASDWFGDGGWLLGGQLMALVRFIGEWGGFRGSG